MTYGPGLPSLEWTLVCQQPKKSLIRLGLSVDRSHGSVDLEDFLPYQSANVKCTGGDPQQWRPMGMATGLMQEAWSGFCQAKSQNLPSLSLPFTMSGNSRVTTVNHVFPVQGQHGQGKLTFACTIMVGPPEPMKTAARLPEGPSVVAGMPNWFNQNGKSTAMYFLRRTDTAAHLQTDRIRDYVAAQEQNASAPSNWAEKSYGRNSDELFEAKLRPFLKAKVGVEAPPAQLWDPDSGHWKTVQVTF